jgi:hypothetical protein
MNFSNRYRDPDRESDQREDNKYEGKHGDWTGWTRMELSNAV